MEELGRLQFRGRKESDTTEQLHSPSPCEVQQILFLPGGSVAKSLPVNARATGDVGSLPGLGRSSGEGNGNPFWYS